MMSSTWIAQVVEPAQARALCIELTNALPEWFGQPEANKRYAEGMAERQSWAVFDAQQGVGLITVEPAFPNNWILYWMAVAPSHHRQGVGKALIQAALDSAVAHGVRSITVETLSPCHRDPGYLQTLRFYEEVGFLPLFDSTPYGPDLVMRTLIRLV